MTLIRCQEVIRGQLWRAKHWVLNRPQASHHQHQGNPWLHEERSAEKVVLPAHQPSPSSECDLRQVPRLRAEQLHFLLRTRRGKRSQSAMKVCRLRRSPPLFLDRQPTLADCFGCRALIRVAHVSFSTHSRLAETTFVVFTSLVAPCTEELWGTLRNSEERWRRRSEGRVQSSDRFGPSCVNAALSFWSNKLTITAPWFGWLK